MLEPNIEYFTNTLANMQRLSDMIYKEIQLPCLYLKYIIFIFIHLKNKLYLK